MAGRVLQVRRRAPPRIRREGGASCARDALSDGNLAKADLHPGMRAAAEAAAREGRIGR